MRVTLLSLLLAAGLSSAQSLVSVTVESATGKKCAPYKNTTIAFTELEPYYNTNGNLDRVVGLYIDDQTPSLCIPYNADGSPTFSGNDYWFYPDRYIHVSNPVKVDYILCGLE